ncbi:MAG: leucyl aminopeptidase [Gammaproteobacteria bacterium]
MHYTLTSGTPEKQRSACVVVGVFEERQLSDAAQALDKISQSYFKKVMQRGAFQGKTGQTLLLHDVPKVLSDCVLLVGCGKADEFNAPAFRKVNASATRCLNKAGMADAVSYLTQLPLADRDITWKVRHAVESAEDVLYRFEQLKSKPESARPTLRKLSFAAADRREQSLGEPALRVGLAVAQGVKLAKDLGNLPGNICTPGYLADQARQIAKQHKRVKVTVLETKDMEKLGMGALLSVARGSRQPPKLIILEYSGAAKSNKPFALVGKGITFDSGGISIKPAAAMDEMKFDMCGAASVLGVLSACAELKLPINVVGVIASSENLPDGNASKPGDIVTSMSGQTIEILNTDAEGRLVLCDALTYTERYKPRAVIDIATLTGACVIALGKHPSGLLSNDDALAQALITAGTNSGDRVWQMPLWDDYQDQLKSNFADMANIGGRDAGTITAACFLSRFTKKFHWAHLDIAGTAWKSGDQKGATGRPVPLLMQYLLDSAA